MRPEIKLAINLYVSHGNRPGDFLLGILTNDLKKTMHYGDDENIKDLKNIYEYIYNSLPDMCWGSKDAVKEWLIRK